MTKKKNVADRSQTDVVSILLKSREVFSKAYTQTGKVSALIAQNKFDQYVIDGLLTTSEARKILCNEDKKLDKILDAAEKLFLDSEQGKISQIHMNTTFKSAMAVGIASGVAVSTVFLLLSPFVSPYIQRAADELTKPNTTGKTETILPTAQQPQKASECSSTTYIFNLNAASPKPSANNNKKTRVRNKAIPYLRHP